MSNKSTFYESRKNKFQSRVIETVNVCSKAKEF